MDTKNFLFSILESKGDFINREFNNESYQSLQKDLKRHAQMSIELSQQLTERWCSELMLGDWYYINIRPCPKPTMTHSARFAGKSPAVQRYLNFRDNVTSWVISLDLSILQAMSIDVIFLLEMPRSWNKNKRAKTFLQPHDTTPDLDNLYKSLSDGIWNKATASNDSKVFSVCMKKIWAGSSGILLKWN